MTEAELREWLKDHIVSILKDRGRTHRYVREYFVLSGSHSSGFRTTNAAWTSLPQNFKKWIFRTALDELIRDNIVLKINGDDRGFSFHSTTLRLNDVLDIMSRIRM